MRRFFSILTLFIASFTLVSCELDTPDFGDQLYASDIAGKWEDNSSTYNYIEFVDLAYYFVTYADNSVKYGTFRKTDDEQFTLSGFGVIDVTTCNDYFLTYALTLDGAENSTSQSTSSVSVGDDYTTDNSYYLNSVWEVSSGGTIGIEYFVFTTAKTFMTIDQSGTANYGSWSWVTDSSTEGEIFTKLASDVNSYNITISRLSSSNATITYRGETYSLTIYTGSF